MFSHTTRKWRLRETIPAGIQHVASKMFWEPLYAMLVASVCNLLPAKRNVAHHKSQTKIVLKN